MYDSSKFSLSWGGISAKGFQDGDGISIEFPNDEATSYVGVRGEGANIQSPDKRCTVTVTLQAVSPTNAAWSALRELGSELPLIMRDRSSAAAVFFAQKAMITKTPNGARGREMPIVEWVFTAPEGRLEHIGEV